ncbi:MAG: sensor histidine kinase [Chitinophagaceae bacterium]
MIVSFRHTGLLFFFILSTSCLWTQDKQLDSLLNLLNKSAADTSKVNLLNSIVSKYQYTDPPKAMEYALQMVELAKKLPFNYTLALAYSVVGGLSIEKTDFASGTKYYTQALEIASKENDLRSKKLTGRIKQSFGVIAYYQEDYSTAGEYYLEAVKVYKEVNDDGLQLVIYNNLSSLHAVMEDRNAALKYAEQCYEVSKRVSDPFRKSMAIVALASAKVELKRYDGVEEILMESKRICEEIKNYILLGRTYSLFGQLMAQRDNNNAKAIEYFEKAIPSLEKSGSQVEVAAGHQRLGEAHSRLGNYLKAKTEITKAIDMARQLGVMQVEMHSLKSLSELEEQNNNKAEALLLLKKYYVINDSINVQGKQKQVSALEAKYETKIKELQIAELQKEKQVQELSIRQKSTFNYILLGSVLTLLVIGFLIYRAYRQKQVLQQQQIKQLESEKLLLATESILKGQEEERSRLAKDLHDGLGGLLSGVKFSLSNMKDNLVVTPDNMAVFERSLDMIDTSIRELRRVAQNMMPEMLTKFGLDEALKDYCNTINATKLMTVKYQAHGQLSGIDKSTEIIIYRIIQELLNNTMKHAGATEAFVQLIKEDSRLSVVVEDNGKGFDASLPENNKGAGWTNIRSRVEYLRGRLDLHSEQGKGTLVNIEFTI